MNQVDVTDLVKAGGKVKVQLDAHVAGHDLSLASHRFDQIRTDSGSGSKNIPPR